MLTASDHGTRGGADAREEEVSIPYTDIFGEPRVRVEVMFTHPLRRQMQRIEKNPWFERTVMCAILVSSVLLAYEGVPDSLVGLELYAGYLVEDALVIPDSIFYGIFMCEFMVKIIAHGFFFTPDSYLGDGANPCWKEELAHA